MQIQTFWHQNELYTAFSARVIVAILVRHPDRNKSWSKMTLLHVTNIFKHMNICCFLFLFFAWAGIFRLPVILVYVFISILVTHKLIIIYTVEISLKDEHNLIWDIKFLSGLYIKYSLHLQNRELFSEVGWILCLKGRA